MAAIGCSSAGKGRARRRAIVARHQLIGDAHQLAEHVVRRIGYADVVAEAFAHLLHAVEPLQDRHDEHNLGRLAFFLLQIAPDQDVEKLIGAAEFDIGLDLDGIPALHDRILDFVSVDRLLLFDPVPEIFALQHLLQRDAAVQADDFVEGHFLEPIAVKDDSRPARIENFEGLLRDRSPHWREPVRA